MSRRHGLLYSIVRTQREYERQQAAAQRAHQRSLRIAEQNRRAEERARLADIKEQQRLYTAIRIDEADTLNDQLSSYVESLNTLLVSAIGNDSYVNLSELKSPVQLPVFSPGNIGIPLPPPNSRSYIPAEPSLLTTLIPFLRSRYEAQLAQGREAFEREYNAYLAREEQRKQSLKELEARHRADVKRAQDAADKQNAEIDQFIESYLAGNAQAIEEYTTIVLERSIYPEGFPSGFKVAFITDSKQLVVEYDYPTYDIIPEVNGYKYVKARDEISSTARPATQRKLLYTSVIAQLTLRVVFEVFQADRHSLIESLVLNGYVDAIDKATGMPVRPCIVTLRVTRDEFSRYNLLNVDPIYCLKALNASVSKGPAELSPVRPVVEFNMVDSRFIQNADVLSSLDNRINLMELTPSEFEALISNLFEKMGLETRLTRASRDGGVDCVAYDPRPIFGGKVVIQAKRYRHTVGVSSVRDLFGTVQNEGASKGILVTTSGYGKASFDFANGKPLELLDGTNLLYLLSEHAGLEAKIQIPDDWRDAQPDLQLD